MNACGDSRLRGLRSRKPIGFRQWVVHYLIIIGFSEAFMCVELTTVGALSGLGRTRLCSIISIAFTSARIPLSIILGGIMGLDGIWWAISSTSIVKGIIFTCTFLWITRKRR